MFGQPLTERTLHPMHASDHAGCCPDLGGHLQRCSRAGPRAAVSLLLAGARRPQALALPLLVRVGTFTAGACGHFHFWFVWALPLLLRVGTSIIASCGRVCMYVCVRVCEEFSLLTSPAPFCSRPQDTPELHQEQM